MLLKNDVNKILNIAAIRTWSEKTNKALYENKIVTKKRILEKNPIFSCTRFKSLYDIIFCFNKKNEKNDSERVEHFLVLFWRFSVSFNFFGCKCQKNIFSEQKRATFFSCIHCSFFTKAEKRESKYFFFYFITFQSVSMHFAFISYFLLDFCFRKIKK